MANEYAPIEATTELAWLLNDAASPYVSSGQASLNLTASGAVSSVEATPLGNVILREDTANIITTETSVGETSGSITIHGWVKWFTHTAYAKIFIKNYNSGTTWSTPYAPVGLAFWNIANRGEFRTVVTTGSAAKTDSGSGYVPRATWTHLAMVFDSTSSEVSSYINGIHTVTDATSGSSIDWGSHGEWWLGKRRSSGSTEGINGMFADFRVEHKAMTPAELIETSRIGRALLIG